MLVLKNLPANAGDIRDSGSIPGLGRFLGGEHGNPLQYSCLENSMDRGTPVSLLGESPWAEEPDGLQSMGSQIAGYNRVTKHAHGLLILLVLFLA